MVKRALSVLLCMCLLSTVVPCSALATTIGEDVTQNFPIEAHMETAAEAAAINTQVTAVGGSASLIQDKAAGKYAVNVTVGDLTNQAFVEYNLAASNAFNILEYSEIKLWVKPGAGSKWAKFYTNNTLILSDDDQDGEFRVGQDLESGKWTQITLDLTKTQTSITQGNSLKVQTNDASTWMFDEVTSVNSTIFTVDLTKTVNNRTQLSGGAIQFRNKTSDTFDITPTVLISQKQAATDTVLTSKSDWDAQTLSDVETASSDGNVKLAQLGTGYSQIATLNADFSGTHVHTSASNNSVGLGNGGYDRSNPVTVYSGTGANCDLNNGAKVVIAADGTLYAALTGSSSPTKIFVYKSIDGGASWTDTALAMPTGTYNQQKPAIAIDSLNNVHLVWTGFDSSYTTVANVKYAKYNGASWSTWNNICNVGYNEDSPTIAVDSSNNVHVAFTYQYTTSTIVGYNYDEFGNPFPVYNYTYYYNIYHSQSSNGTNWSNELAAQQTLHTISNPSMAIDSNNVIYIVFSGTDSSNPSTPQIKWTKKTGSSWSYIANVASINGYSQTNPAITVDGNNRVHAVWKSYDSNWQTNPQVRYAICNGSWSGGTETVCPAALDHSSPGVSVDSNGNVYAVCMITDNGVIRAAYNKRTTSGWGAWTCVSGQGQAVSSLGLCQNYRYFTNPIMLWSNGTIQFYGTWGVGLNYTSGTYTHPVQDVSGVGTVGSSSINFNKTILPDVNTNLLMHMDGADNGTIFADDTGKLVTSNGDAATKTSNIKFGTASAYFDGNGDYLTLPDSTDFDFGSGNFTIDFWFKPTSNVGEQFLFNKGSGTGFVPLRISYSDTNNSGKINVYASTDGGSWAANFSSTSQWAANQWYHLALVRNSSGLYLYKSGVLDGQGSVSGALTTNTYGPNIGSWDGIASFYTGYIDEFRISKGAARWTGNFTPPTIPYSISNVGNVIVSVRTSNDGGTTWGAWTAKNSGDTLFEPGTNLANYRMQWKVDLTTTDTSRSPALNDVQVVVDGPYKSSGVLTSSIIDNSGRGGVTMAYNATVPSGTTLGLEWRESRDGNTWSAWQPVVAGQTYGSEDKFQWRANFATSNANITPILHDVTMTMMGGDYVGAPALPAGKLSKVFIDSTYKTISASVSELPSSRMYLTDIKPTKIALSGDGNMLVFKNPNDSDKLYTLNLSSGESAKIGDFAPVEMKSDLDGNKIAYRDTSNNLYLTGVPTVISANVSMYAIDNNGIIAYYNSNTGAIYLYTGASQKIYTGAVTCMDITRSGEQVFFSNTTNLRSVVNTPAGWKDSLLVTTGSNITGIWSNSDGTLVFLKLADGSFYVYESYSKALRKLGLTASTIIRVTNDNQIIAQDANYNYVSYNPETDQTTKIRPFDAKNPPSATDPNFDVDLMGTNIAYVAGNTMGIATGVGVKSLQVAETPAAPAETPAIPTGAERPERYLFSFDSKNSWLSYKDGMWVTVKAGGVPSKDDFDQYGMTIDEVNGLTEKDFSYLYEDGRQIFNFDVAIYFASVNPYITPSLKGILVTLSRSGNGFGNELTEKALFAAKQEIFDGTNWRKIRKIYPIELSPKEAELHYFIFVDSAYKAYKTSAWQDVPASIFTNVETSWIDVTLKGMSAEELRAIPEADLTTLLHGKSFNVVYCMKVLDASTVQYKSKISVDYVEDLFASATLTLKIAYNDGSNKQYTGLTDAQVEDFMQWLNERQFNRGPIYYRIKTGSNNDFINYYMIQSVNVVEG